MPYNEQAVLVILMRLMLDPDNPARDRHKALAIAVESGWIEACGVDEEGKTKYRVTPAGEDHIATMKPSDFRADRDADLIDSTHGGEDANE